jgi:hypothetical protein
MFFVKEFLLKIMSWKKLIFIIVIISIAVLASVYFLVLRGSKQKDIMTVNKTQRQAVALNKKVELIDAQLCQQFTGKEKEACDNQLLYQKAIMEANTQQCLGINDQLTKERCIFKIALDNNDAGKCQVLSGVALNTCQDNYWLNKALAQGKKELCQNIAGEGQKSGCLMELGEVKILDSDSDGLDDEEEKIYGTDPKNPDTDGDGYQDGQEVKSGYNPLGPGKLVK